MHSVLISTQPTATIHIFFYFLVIIPSPTYIGFNLNPNRTNGLISPHGFLPQKHTLTTKQPKNSENHHHHVHLCPPLSGGFNFLKVSKIALRRTMENDLCNMAIQILYVQLTLPLFFLLLFYTSWLSTLAD